MDPGFFKGGLGGNRYSIYKNHIYIAIIHIIILINEVHFSAYCAEATAYMLLFLELLCTNVNIHLHGHLVSHGQILFCAGALSLAVSVSTVAVSAPTVQAIMPLCELGSGTTRLGHLCPLHFHMDTSILSLLSCYQYLSIHLSDNSSRKY